MENFYRNTFSLSTFCAYNPIEKRRMTQSRKGKDRSGHGDTYYQAPRCLAPTYAPNIFSITARSGKLAFFANSISLNKQYKNDATFMYRKQSSSTNPSFLEGWKIKTKQIASSNSSCCAQRKIRYFRKSEWKFIFYQFQAQL